MSLPPNEDKKPDFSNLPRGAISIKGLPVNRNARLPSIRTPRDLTLGSQPKRTFLPNIPVRREKRAAKPERTLVPPPFQNSSGNSLPKEPGRGSGRKRDSGRGKPVIIQTEGSVFGEGISGDSVPRRERQRDSYQSYGKAGTSHGIAIKKEQVNSEVSHAVDKLNDLLLENFIDDGDEVEERLKPVTFPFDVKSEEKTKKEENSKEDCQKSVKQNFDPEVAKNMGYDIQKVAKFIKKEKGVEEIKEPVDPSFSQLNEDIYKCFNLPQSELLLLQFPNCVTVPESNVDADSSQGQRSQPNGETNLSDDQNKKSSMSSLPEGRIGTLQLLKSGKIRMVLGSLKFELDKLTPLFAKHEAVSVRTTDNSGDLVSLGNMVQKLKFAPDVGSLL